MDIYEPKLEGDSSFHLFESVSRENWIDCKMLYKVQSSLRLVELCHPLRDFRSEINNDDRFYVQKQQVNITIGRDAYLSLVGFRRCLQTSRISC